MVGLTLEPYAAVLHWTAGPEHPALEPAVLAFLETLAGKCQAVELPLNGPPVIEHPVIGPPVIGPPVIGHIKALALFPDGTYLRASAVAAHLPATLEGAVPPGCEALDMTLNVLVYGLAARQLAALTQAAAETLMQRYPLKIEIVSASQKGAAPHAHAHA